MIETFLKELANYEWLLRKKIVNNSLVLDQQLRSNLLELLWSVENQYSKWWFGIPGLTKWTSPIWRQTHKIINKVYDYDSMQPFDDLEVGMTYFQQLQTDIEHLIQLLMTDAR